MKSQIDFTLLLDNTKGYAVHCSNEEDAKLFVQCAKELYPEMCTMWDDGETNYSKYGSETIYTFCLRTTGGRWVKSRLMYGSGLMHRNIGFTIIEFSDIYQAEDINESDLSIDALFW